MFGHRLMHQKAYVKVGLIIDCDNIIMSGPECTSSPRSNAGRGERHQRGGTA